MTNDFITFIDEEYLKAVSTVDLNLDSSSVIPIIISAQEQQILPLLGTNLYNEIRTQIDSDSVSSSNEILLTAYTKMALAHWVLYEGLPFWHYKITNKAIEKKTGEHSENASLNELEYLRDNLRNKAEFFSERVTKYLIANSNIYPKYTDAGSTFDTIHPKANNYTSGLYLPNRNNSKFYGNPSKE